MPCYHPLEGFRSQSLTKNGKRKLTFSAKSGYVDLPQTVPCGQCIGCRLERSRQWAVRCVHEAQSHVHNCFVTLTYSDEHLPEGRTLVKADFQKFMKRLRKHYGKSVRYYHCGEYGDLDDRPHYHALLFGIDFPDKKPHSKNGQGDVVYKSELLERIWGKGFCTIGALTFETAAYTARYVMKKVNGKNAESHYESIDPESGEVRRRVPEYATMSLKPGIGGDWFDKYKSDVFPADEVVLRGKQQRAPRFYDRRLEQDDPGLLLKIKRKRTRSAKKHKADQTPERLAVREEVKLSQLKTLSRNL